MQFLDLVAITTSPPLILTFVLLILGYVRLIKGYCCPGRDSDIQGLESPIGAINRKKRQTIWSIRGQCGYIDYSPFF